MFNSEEIDDREYVKLGDAIIVGWTRPASQNGITVIEAYANTTKRKLRFVGTEAAQSWVRCEATQPGSNPYEHWSIDPEDLQLHCNPVSGDSSGVQARPVRG